jgi:hypothetical protein
VADTDLRTRQRAWEANPGDQPALAAYIRALRAAGQLVRPDLLEQRVFPPRRVRLPEGAKAWIPGDTGPETELEEWVGPYSGCHALEPRDGVIEVPEHRELRIELLPRSDEDLGTMCGILAAQDVRCLSVECPNLTDTGLSALTRLPSLERLSLGQAHGLTAAGLKHLTALGHLFELSVQRLQELGEASLELPQSLLALDLFDLQLDDTCLARLAEAGPGLLSLQVHDDRRPMEGVTDEGLRPLADLGRLETLSLDSCARVTDTGLEHLAALPLRSLHLWWASFTDAGLAILGRSSHLRELVVRGDVSSAGLKHLQGLPLESLSLSRLSSLDGDGLTALPTSLVDLDITVRGHVGGDVLAALPRFEALTGLHLPLPRDVTDDELAPLGQLQHLQRLTLELGRIPHPTLTDAFLDHLRPLLRLRSLELDLPLGEGSLAPLSVLTELRKLTLEGVGGAWEQLATLKHLRSLTLNRGRLGSGLTALQSLRDLDLAGCSGVDDQTLGWIAQLAQLEELYFYRAGPFTPRGLQALAGLPRLRRLTLSACEGEGLDDSLRARLPACEVTIR